MAFKWDPDRVISVCEMVVGVGSLFTIGYQAALTRQMQHASVLPYLYISLGASEPPADFGGRDDSDGRIRYERTKAAARRMGGEKAVNEITYKSVYGDRWGVRSDRIVPEKL